VEVGTVLAGGDVINQTIFQGWISDPRLALGARVGSVNGLSTATAPAKLFENVPPRDLNFTGRENQLIELHNILLGANHMQVAIHGLGGIGKTSLAAEYAHQYANAYAGVWWAPAERRPLLIASLAAFGTQIDPTLARETDQDKVARAGLARFPHLSKPYLFIFDNVESPDAIRNLVPTAGARLIITTRWVDWSGQAAELKLNVLDPNSAAHFLQLRAGRHDALGAKNLSAAVGHLPLALDHAGAYCRLAGSRFEDYRQTINARIARAPKAAAYPASIAATLSLAIEKVSTGHTETEDLLGFFAWLGPNRIPLDLVPPSIAQGDVLREALMNLSAVSLVEHTMLDDGNPAVDVHPLVQIAMRARLESARKTVQSANCVACSLFERFPEGAGNKPELWSRCAELLPHVLSFRGHKAEEFCLTEGIIGLFANAGHYLRGRRSYSDAESFLRQVVSIAEQRFGNSDARTILHMNELAFSCLELISIRKLKISCDK
jgi:hypothetical protein